MMNRNLSVFDLDHTLVVENSSYRFSCFLFRQRVLSAFSFLQSSWYYLRHLFFGLPLTELHKKIFHHLLKGLSPDRLKIYVDQFVKEFLDRSLYMPAFSRLRLAQQSGERTAIFSNSPDFLVGPIAQLLHVDEWQATSYLLDNEHQLSEISCIVDGEQKAVYLKQMIQNLKLEKSQVTVYSDSYTDLAFLVEAGQPIAVNPDQRLRAYAQEHDWLVI